MAMPVTSWQGVVLGDPLYQPFKHFDGSGVKQDADIEFRALRAAALEWKNNPLELQKQLKQASERMKSGILAEAVGLDFLRQNDPAAAAQWFRTARGHYLKEDDKLRQDFNLIALDRTANHKDAAVRGLRDGLLVYRTLPEVEALKGWLDILDPPPPPPADPTKVPAVKTP